MYSKIFTASCVAVFFAGAAAAQLPGVDAPTGAGRGLSDSVERKVEGSGPINGGTGATVTEPAEGSVRGGNVARDTTVPFPGSGTLKDAVELCERLAGVERQICLQQARENRERALTPGVGATPGGGGAGSGREERRAPAAR
jgi:hypothetical protein